MSQGFLRQSLLSDTLSSTRVLNNIASLSPTRRDRQRQGREKIDDESEVTFHYFIYFHIMQKILQIPIVIINRIIQ